MYSLRILFVLCTVPLVLSVPLAPINKHDSILKLIANDKNACTFPPKEVLSKPLRAPSILSCDTQQIPDLSDIGEGLKSIETYFDASGNNELLLCMGLYDVSLQLCKAGVPNEAIPSNTQQFNNLFSEADKGVDTICKNLNSYVDQHTSFPITSDWIHVLNDNLKTESSCKNICLQRRGDKLHVQPLCSIILWGRQLIHELLPANQQQRGSPDQGDLSHEAANNNQGSTIQDLEAPDTLSDSQNPTVENKAMLVNENKPESSSTILSKEKQPVAEPAEVQKVSVVKQSEPTPSIVAILPKSDMNVKTGRNEDPVFVKNADSLSKKMEPAQSNPSQKSSVSVPLTSQTVTQVSTQAPIEQEVAPVSESQSPADIPVPEAGVPESEEQYAEQPIDDPNATLQNAEQGDDDDDDLDLQQPSEFQHQEPQKEVIMDPDVEVNLFGSPSFKDAEDSHFFAYFLTLSLICIIGYLVFHNKNKILALVLEGRRGVSASRRGRSPRRPSTSSYRKLDTTLEEAISSGAPRTNSNVIY